MDANKLRPDTKKLWKALEDHPLLKGFVLLGGTALTLRIGHRVSEDLDFAYPSGILPDSRIKALVKNKRERGNDFVLNQNPLDVEDAIEHGLDLNDNHRDFIVNSSVKVSFFSPGRESAQLTPADPDDRLRVATLDEIFATKCLVCADRSKTRDWFDLYILMTKHGYEMMDMYRVFEKYGIRQKFDIASVRLRKATPQVGDEGYLQLIDSPPSLETMREFFAKELDELEVQIAKSAFQENSMRDGMAPE